MIETDEAFMYRHAWAYADHQRDPSPAEYAGWYVAEFGEDGIDRAPSHSSVYSAFYDEKRRDHESTDL